MPLRPSHAEHLRDKESEYERCQTEKTKSDDFGGSLDSLDSTNVDESYPDNARHAIAPFEASDHFSQRFPHNRDVVGTWPSAEKGAMNQVQKVFKEQGNRDQDSFASDEIQPVQSDRKPWNPKLVQFGALSGIFAMIVALACLVASLGILAGSDGEAVSNWRASPATYIAISTAMANLAMRYAAIQGVVIAWWLKAMRGSSLSQLHNDWRSGSTFRGAITAGRHMGLLGLACIFSTIVVIDGPLLQRASTVIPADFRKSVSLNVAITPELPSTFTGSWVERSQSTIPENTFRSNQTTLTNPGSSSNDLFLVTSLRVLNRLCWLWYYDAPQYMVDGCSGNCNATITAPALAVTSSKSYSVPANGTLPEDLFDPTENTVVPPLNKQAFMISSKLIYDESETIRLVTGYSTSESCAGDFSYTVSYLKSAIGEYEMSIAGNTAIIISSHAAAHPQIVSLANNTRVSPSVDQEEFVRQSTLGGIVDFSFMGWADWVSYFDFDGFVEIATGGNGASEQYYYNVDGHCQGYKDPHDAVIASLNKLMVNAGWNASTMYSAEWLQERMDPGVQASTSTTAYQVGTRNTYHTDYYFFLGAAIVEVVCILFVAPTYWGWWKLGRPVSFSPLEFAKAFEAPLLADGDSNSRGRDLARKYGDVHVQYGVKRRAGTSSSTKLAFVESSSVDWPRKGERF